MSRRSTRFPMKLKRFVLRFQSHDDNVQGCTFSTSDSIPDFWRFINSFTYLLTYLLTCERFLLLTNIIKAIFCRFEVHLCRFM